MNKITNKGVLLSVLVLSTQTYASTPLFTLLPHTTNTLSIPENGSFFSQYIVANNSTYPRMIVPRPMRGVTQITSPGYCSHPQLLNPGESCILNLRITASEIGTGLNQGPEVCKTRYGTTSPDLQYCSRPAAENLLNVSVVPNTSNRRVLGGWKNNGTKLPYVFATDDAGETWETVPLQMPTGATSADIRSIACDVNGLHCVAVGVAGIAGATVGMTYTSPDGGFSWGSPSLLTTPTGTTGGSISSISCSDSGEHCTIVRNYSSRGYVFQSNDGGNTWGAPVPVNQRTGDLASILIDVSCDANGINCVAAGRTQTSIQNYPSIWHQNMETNSWELQVLTPPAGTDALLRTIECAKASSRCQTAGIRIFNSKIETITYYSTDSGLSWNGPQVLSGNNDMFTLNCSSNGLFCVIGGESNIDSTTLPKEPLTRTTMDGGETWSEPVITPHAGTIDNSFNAIFCDATGVDCTAVGQGLTNNSTQTPQYLFSSRSTNGGNSWSPAETFEQANEMNVGDNGMSGSR